MKMAVKWICQLCGRVIPANREHRCFGKPASPKSDKE